MQNENNLIRNQEFLLRSEHVWTQAMPSAFEDDHLIVVCDLLSDWGRAMADAGRRLFSDTSPISDDHVYFFTMKKSAYRERFPDHASDVVDGVVTVLVVTCQTPTFFRFFKRQP